MRSRMDKSSEVSLQYYRLMLGRKSSNADTCIQNNFIGVDFGLNFNLSNELVDEWKVFNKKFIPEYLKTHPDSSKVKAGLACGMIHTMSIGIKKGDIVLCPDGNRSYRFAEVVSDYYYHEEGPLPHRRQVKWLDLIVSRDSMSEALKNSAGAISTLINITKHSSEIESYINNEVMPDIKSTNPDIEDPTGFALEQHLEDFLVTNWDQTILSSKYDIYSDDEMTGQQFPTDTGRIDILAISKDKKELLVIELKKGRASDAVVGQIQRYMGYIKDEILEEHQIVSGIIIALEDDAKIKRALSVTKDITFYRYRVNFELHKS